MAIQDKKQNQFSDYIVPDQGRILKVKKWLLDKKYLSQDSVLNILEIGYSRGGLLDNLTGYHKIKKYALDINHKKTDKDIVFFQHDYNEGLPDLDGLKFNIIFAGEVIEHIYDDEKFLKNIHMQLEKRGVLIITTPNLFFLPNRILFPFGVKPFFAWAEYHYHIYDIKNLSDIVKRSGYEIENIKSSHILISSRRYKRIGKFFEILGNWLPKYGAHIILFAKKNEIT